MNWRHERASTSPLFHVGAYPVMTEKPFHPETSMFELSDTVPDVVKVLPAQTLFLGDGRLGRYIQPSK
jgi:hypothetical protein